jgi:hypothetical protein
MLTVGLGDLFVAADTGRIPHVTNSGRVLAKGESAISGWTPRLEADLDEGRHENHTAPTANPRMTMAATRRRLARAGGVLARDSGGRVLDTSRSSDNSARDPSRSSWSPAVR